MSLAGSYARLAGALTSDLATVEIELNAALRALARGDAAAARAAIIMARDSAAAAQQRAVQTDP
jgi:hypothetical protein